MNIYNYYEAVRADIIRAFKDGDYEECFTAADEGAVRNGVTLQYAVIYLEKF